MLTSSEIRTRFLIFFEKRGHTIIPSASLVPLNDPSVLFNTAGMQPLVPYLLGQPHPGGTRLVDSQKCVRTVDIDEIGDNTHATFFEMLGNWSLGDYFKNDAINWSFEFLTSKDEGLGLDPRRLYITVFEKNNDAPRDEESHRVWTELFTKAGVIGERIYYMGTSASGKEPNWWSAGDSGPCGPDSEMFYDVTGKLTEGLTKAEFLAADERQDIVEIWNDVFMEYLKEGGVVVGKLAKQNVDTGSGLERITAVVQGKTNIFETDLFAPIIEKIRELGFTHEKREQRIIADHLRTAVFLIGDGVIPSNTDQGYVLRRLIRRAVAVSHGGGNTRGLVELVPTIVAIYATAYPMLTQEKDRIESEIEKEELTFRQTLTRGLKVFEGFAQFTDGNSTENRVISPEKVFELITTHGFPREIVEELARGREINISWEEVETLLKKHQDISRAGSEQKFKGGLADHGEETVKLHTAHHLLLRALQMVLGADVHQRGSNITSERLRIDFACPQKMTDEQKKEVERIVNEKISEALPIIRTEMSLDDAEKLGAEHEFGAKYPERVSVYSVGPKAATPEDPQFEKRFSIEFCGGPHVTNTSQLGHFKILKEEAVSQGVRRIKAVLE